MKRSDPVLAVPLLYVSLALPLALLLPAPLLAGAPWQTVALSGVAAPGTPAGTTFLAFGSPYDANLPVPQVDDQGGVLFFAYLDGPGVDGSNGHGLWLFDGARIQPVARAGDPAGSRPWRDLHPLAAVGLAQ